VVGVRRGENVGVVLMVRAALKQAGVGRVS
jgi:hypothetical protein